MNSSSREKGIAKPRKTVSFWALGCLPLTKSFRKVFFFFLMFIDNHIK